MKQMQATMLIPILYAFRSPKPFESEEKRLKALRILYVNILKRGWKIMKHATFESNSAYKVMIYDPSKHNTNGDIYPLPIFLQPAVR